MDSRGGKAEFRIRNSLTIEAEEEGAQDPSEITKQLVGCQVTTLSLSLSLARARALSWPWAMNKKLNVDGCVIVCRCALGVCTHTHTKKHTRTHKHIHNKPTHKHTHKYTHTHTLWRFISVYTGYRGIQTHAHIYTHTHTQRRGAALWRSVEEKHSTYIHIHTSAEWEREI